MNLSGTYVGGMDLRLNLVPDVRTIYWISLLIEFLLKFQAVGANFANTKANKN